MKNTPARRFWESPELRAMLAEQDKLGERIHVELDLLRYVLWVDGIQACGSLKSAEVPALFEEEE